MKKARRLGGAGDRHVVDGVPYPIVRRPSVEGGGWLVLVAERPVREAPYLAGPRWRSNIAEASELYSQKWAPRTCEGVDRSRGGAGGGVYLRGMAVVATCPSSTTAQALARSSSSTAPGWAGR